MSLKGVCRVSFGHRGGHFPRVFWAFNLILLWSADNWLLRAGVNIDAFES